MTSEYYYIATGYGGLHIHINFDASGPKQVFCNLPPLGTEISGLAASTGILISKYLEIGGDPRRLIKHLNSVKGDKPIGFGEKRIDSIPHAISVALKKHLDMHPIVEKQKDLLAGETDLEAAVIKNKLEFSQPEPSVINIAPKLIAKDFD